MDEARQEARRWVRRKRTFLTILAVYLVLCLLWLAVDLLTGPDSLWFYWPVLGAGLIVAVIGLAMFGLGGLFGGDWERRQVDRYLERRAAPEDGGDARPDQGPGDGSFPTGRPS
jgi:2TM domain